MTFTSSHCLVPEVLHKISHPHKSSHALNPCQHKMCILPCAPNDSNEKGRIDIPLTDILALNLLILDRARQVEPVYCIHILCRTTTSPHRSCGIAHRSPHRRSPDGNRNSSNQNTKNKIANNSSLLKTFLPPTNPGSKIIKKITLRTLIVPSQWHESQNRQRAIYQYL